jgi:hydrogenase nickel incorporation protein HypB
MSIEKSTKAARGTVQCENTNINLLKANDFVADIIKKQMAESKNPFSQYYVLCGKW